jgi:hypothetical protein
MAVDTPYKFLEYRPGSNYRQMFLKGRNLRAEILYRAIIGPEPRTVDEVASDYGVPREAVEEAVDYCVHHADVLQQEREDVLADIRRRGLALPSKVPGNGTTST